LAQPKEKPTTPLVHKTINPDLKKFIISQSSMRHNDAMIEFVERSPTFSGSMIVTQFNHLAIALVESQLVA
jgi:hypothetical protein